MTTPEERLQCSLADFYATLDALSVTGVSQVAETQQLKILIDKYPNLAWQFLTDRRGRHGHAPDGELTDPPDNGTTRSPATFEDRL